VDVRTALLEAAVAEFAAAGTRGATTRRIARAAGVNEVTLFRHFRSKGALLQAALEQFVERVERQTLPADPVDPQVELLQWANAQYRTLHRHRAFIRKVMSEREEHPDYCSVGMRASASITAELAAYFGRVRKAGLADPDGWDERAAASMLFGTLLSDAMGRDTVPDRYPYSRRDAVEWYVDLIARAIGARTRPRRTRKRGPTAS
jgi:AcrR family transcriptional regulator